MADSLHPLYQTNQVDGVLTVFPVAERSQLLSTILPLTTRNSDKIEVDIDKSRRGGMTPMVSPGSESPVYSAEGRAQLRWYPAEFREKVRIVEHELIDRRKLGTVADLETARELLDRKTQNIQMRLATRIEWMRRQALFDGAVTAKDEAGVEFTVNYTHPSYLEPSAGTAWTTVASATPISDMQLWVEDYMNSTGMYVKSIHLPQGTLRQMAATAQFKNLFTNNLSAYNGSLIATKRAVADFIGVGIVEESQNRIEFQAELTAASASSDTTLNLTDVGMLEAGTEIYACSLTDMDKEKLVVDSISGNVVTVASPGVAKTAGYAPGDVVKWSIKTIPAGKILMVGTPFPNQNRDNQQATPDRQLMENWGQVVSTLSRYENLDNAKAGLFRKTIDKINDDPPRIEQIIGIRALPVIFYNEGYQICDYLA